MSFHRLDDPRDPIRHDMEDEVRIQKAVRERYRKWAAEQTDEWKKLYCEHGSYVGFKRALAYKCKFCQEVA